jgi:hypothetical protein
MYWTEHAKKAVEDGYLKGNRWEHMLERHLRRLFPKLVKELGKEFPAYLQVKTSQALNLKSRLILEQGMAPEVADELAKEELLPRLPADENRPERWEAEGQEDTQAEAFRKFLLNSPTPSRPPRTTPRT